MVGTEGPLNENPNNTNVRRTARTMHQPIVKKQSDNHPFAYQFNSIERISQRQNKKGNAC